MAQYKFIKSAVKPPSGLPKPRGIPKQKLEKSTGVGGKIGERSRMAIAIKSFKRAGK